MQTVFVRPPLLSLFYYLMYLELTADPPPLLADLRARRDRLWRRGPDVLEALASHQVQGRHLEVAERNDQRRSLERTL